MTPVLHRTRPQVKPKCTGVRYTPGREHCRYGVAPRNFFGAFAGGTPPTLGYSAVTIGTANTATSVTVNKPAGVGVGWVLRVMLTANAARTWTTLSGWTLMPGITAGSQATCLYRILDGSEGSSFTFACTGGTANLRAGMVGNSGLHPTTPFGACNFNQNASASSNVNSGVTVTDGKWVDSLIFRIGSAGTVTKPATMTQDFQDNSNQSFAGAHEDATPGATGNRTWTWSVVSVCGVIVCELRTS